MLVCPVTLPVFDQQVVMPPSVMFRELDGESVLLNLDSERYYGLDAAGTRFWEILAATPTVQAGFERLLEEFEVEPALLRSDLEALMGELAEHGLIVLIAA
jgi:hypothetical protein